MELMSKAFEDGYEMPKVHTCDGDDLSPPLRWENEPKGTVSFALIMEDPGDKNGSFTHWMMYNIPPDCHDLEKITPIQKNLDNGAIQAQNDFGKIGYRGPCPPKGEEHEYKFRLYALKKKLPPESLKNGDDFHAAMNGLVLDQAEYTARYYRNT